MNGTVVTYTEPHRPVVTRSRLLRHGVLAVHRGPAARDAGPAAAAVRAGRSGT
jgi:hypothetical protein